MNEEIVITRAYAFIPKFLHALAKPFSGGHCGRNASGGMEQISDHSSAEACILSFRNNMICQYPLALIVGEHFRSQRVTEIEVDVYDCRQAKRQLPYGDTTPVLRHGLVPGHRYLAREEEGHNMLQVSV